MNRLIFILTLLFLASCGAGNGSSQTGNLKELEKIGKEEKIKLIESLKPQFEYLATYDTWVNDNLNNFYFVDLDNDNDRDLVFTGWSGAEPVCVRIFVNKDNVYENVFSEFQTIQRIEFTKDRLSHLIIEDPGCCAEYILFTEDYEVEAGKDQIEFSLTNRIAIIHETELPTDFFPTPIQFEVLNDKYFMRNSAMIDTVDQYYGGELGTDNIIAEFNRGTKGRALGEKLDDTGRVWWFVEIDPDFKPVNSMFYDLDRNNTKVRGWMSSHYLERK